MRWDDDGELCEVSVFEDEMMCGMGGWMLCVCEDFGMLGGVFLEINVV